MVKRCQPLTVCSYSEINNVCVQMLLMCTPGYSCVQKTLFLPSALHNPRWLLVTHIYELCAT